MQDKDKIKLLKDILGDKDLISKGILKEEDTEPTGVLSVEAEGESPEDAKEKIVEQLQTMDLPDEEEMGEIVPEEMGEDEELYEDMLDEEDQDILESLPEKTRESFKQRLLDKIKKM